MGAVVICHEDWETALERAVNGALAGLDRPPDLAALFVSADWQAHFPDLIARASAMTGARVLVGCSGQGVIGPGTEVEGEPAIALMALRLPGAILHAAHLTHDELGKSRTTDDVRRLASAPPDDVDGWIVLADPFHLDCEGLLGALAAAYPGVPLVGGLASGLASSNVTHVFLDGRVYPEGAVCLAVGGDYTIRTLVSQGCQPIGEPWTITAVDRNLVSTIANRPAYDVLVETFESLAPAQQLRARRNLLVGLAMNEYQDSFGRGDFLIRNLIGVDRRSGALSIGAVARVGQTLQFHVRDAEAADQELGLMLASASAAMGELRPVGAFLCSCNGRGRGLFGVPSHDAARVAELLGPIPLAGLFCNGEIGPVGGKAYLHGFTASLGLIVPKGSPTV